MISNLGIKNFIKVSLIASTLTLSPNLLAKKKTKLITEIPENYQSLSACEKQSFLWKQIEESAHSKLPNYNKMDVMKLIAMGFQSMTKKISHDQDVAPKGWKKYLHRRGSVAKVKIVPVENKNNVYTGVFKGADCALVRLSLTFRPNKKRDVAPGLALKVLRDKVPSANVSALYALEGQKKNYNFFENSLSNIVPIGSGAGPKLVHSIFARVTDYPEQLNVKDFAVTDTKGQKVEKPVYPVQLFFVPTEELKTRFSSDKHEVRMDFGKIQPGTTLYKVYAVSPKHKDFNYYDYTLEKKKEFLEDSIEIAKIVMTSGFISSEFGDTKIFFKHQTVD